MRVAERNARHPATPVPCARRSPPWYEEYGSTPTNAFRKACAVGALEAVRALLAGDFGVLTVDVNMESERPFRAACRAGHVEVVKELLALRGSRHVNVRVRQGEAFTAACGAGQADVVAVLLGLDGHRRVKPGANNDAALVAACEGGHAAVVAQLLALKGKRAVNVNARHGAPLSRAVEGHHLPVVQMLVAAPHGVDAHAQGCEALRRAAVLGDAAVAAAILPHTDGRLLRQASLIRAVLKGAAPSMAHLLLTAPAGGGVSAATVRELGLLPQRADAAWAGTPLRPGRRTLLAWRTRLRAARLGGL